MKKIMLFALVIVGLVSCNKEDILEVESGETVFHFGHIGLSTVVKTAIDTIGDIANPVTAYKIKVKMIQVAREDAVNWYTLLDSTNTTWIDLVNGTGVLNLKDTLLVGTYTHAFIQLDSIIIERAGCATKSAVKSNVGAVFIPENNFEINSTYLGQVLVAYNDTVIASGDTTITKTKASIFHPNIRNKLATDSLYWMMGENGLVINKNQKGNFIIGIHPEVVNRDLQSAPCGTGVNPILFIGTQANYSARDTVKAKY